MSFIVELGEVKVIILEVVSTMKEHSCVNNEGPCRRQVPNMNFVLKEQVRGWGMGKSMPNVHI